jgi:hypothetical protein
MTNRARQLAWEERWARPAAVAALIAVAAFVAAVVLATQAAGGGDGDSEVLRNIDVHRGTQLLSSILQAIGVGLLAVPLYYLFRAANARSETMRGQLVGVVVAAPLFLAVLAILTGVSTMHAAGEFVSDEVPRLLAKGVGLNSDRANDVANDAIANAPLSPLAAGFEIGGRIGFVVAMFYTALHAMRTGLLTRFWGSLGVALGAVSFLPPFFPFVLFWFLYLGLLIAGWVPGSRPPAWASGEAIPWPTPGEKAANELSSPPEDPDPAEPAEKGQSG